MQGTDTGHDRKADREEKARGRSPTKPEEPGNDGDWLIHIKQQNEVGDQKSKVVNSRHEVIYSR